MNDNRRNLSELIDKFIEYKRSIGHDYNSGVYSLQRFSKFCENLGITEIPDKSVFQQWVKRIDTEEVSSHKTRISPIREFCSFLENLGYDIYLIPKKVCGHTERQQPYYLTQNEIDVFFNTCDTLKPRKENPGREQILPAVFRLLLCCGLRPKEARYLKNENVNLLHGYIDIIKTKRHKSRRLFLTSEVTEYMKKYNSSISNIFPERVYFFPKNMHDHYCDNYLITNFRTIWNTANPEKKDCHVRVYDFRHHFAFENLNRWVREGKDVNTMIVYLMKYMGHASIKGTRYYLHLVPEFFPTYEEVVRSFENILPEAEYEQN